MQVEPADYVSALIRLFQDGACRTRSLTHTAPALYLASRIGVDSFEEQRSVVDASSLAYLVAWLAL